MKATRKMLSDVRSCCHHGHGASVFANGDVIQAISYNDVIARGASGGSGWEYRIAYIDDPEITLDDLQRVLEQSNH